MEAVNVLDAALLPRGEHADRSMEPLAERPAPRSFELGQDRRHLAWRQVPDELRLVDGKGFIEVLAVVPRQIHPTGTVRFELEPPSRWTRTRTRTTGKVSACSISASTGQPS